MIEQFPRGIIRRLRAVMRDANSRRYGLQRLYGLIFRAGVTQCGAVYLNYHPDSHFVFRAHPEFPDLVARFRKHNRWNNGGDAGRLWAFILNVKQIIAEQVPGAFAEVGVWRGNSAAVLARLARPENRQVYLFDTFAGFAAADLQGIDQAKETQFADTSVALARDVIGPEHGHCRFVQGHFPASVTDEHRNARYAMVSLDCDLYEPMKAGLEFFYPRMAAGGIFLLHDYSSLAWNGAALAINEFCQASGEHLLLLPDKSGSAMFRKTGRAG